MLFKNDSFVSRSDKEVIVTILWFHRRVWRRPASSEMLQRGRKDECYSLPLTFLLKKKAFRSYPADYSERSEFSRCRKAQEMRLEMDFTSFKYMPILSLHANCPVTFLYLTFRLSLPKPQGHLRLGRIQSREDV